jgi:hypothetical protein
MHGHAISEFFCFSIEMRERPGIRHWFDVRLLEKSNGLTDIRGSGLASSPIDPIKILRPCNHDNFHAWQVADRSGGSRV